MFSSIHAVLSLSRLVTPLKETKGAWREDTGVVPVVADLCRTDWALLVLHVPRHYRWVRPLYRL